MIDSSAGEIVFVFLLIRQHEHPPESFISKVIFVRIPPIGEVLQNAIVLSPMREIFPNCRYADRSHRDLLSSSLAGILIQ
jgi:hypothetical protein